MRKLSNAGDTIVEVLLAIAVVSSVLGISYTIMRRNIITLLDNQERTAASKIAQGQVEGLRNHWASSDNGNAPWFTGAGGVGGGGFCYNGGTLIDSGFTGGTPRDNADHANEVPSNYPAQCQDGIYRWGIIREGGASEGLYRVYVRWDSVSGNDQEVVMVYELQ